MTPHRRLTTRLVACVLGGVAFLAAFLWCASANVQAGTRGLEGASSTKPHSLPALTSDLTIPQAAVDVTLDGVCDAFAEYADALSVDFNDASQVTGTIYLQHDGNYMYVCMVGALGAYDSRFASLYLDTDNGQETFAQSEDLAFRVNIEDSVTSSATGTGSGNYSNVTLSGWYAQASYDNYDMAEYEIPITSTGGLCGNPFGLAVYHHWVAFQSDDYGWPGALWYDAPYTWSTTSLESAPCPSADLSLQKSDTPDPVSTGAELTYLLTVTNNSLATALNVVLTDSLPASMAFLSTNQDEACSEYKNQVSCMLGNLSGGSAVTVSIQALPYQAGAFTNTAGVAADVSDSNPQDNLASAQTAVNQELTCGGVFTATADASLVEKAPDANHGADTWLQVIQADNDSRALLAFDLANALPVGANIQEATLELTLLQQPYPQTFTLQAYSLSQEWQEYAVTWNTQPAAGVGFGEISFSPVYSMTGLNQVRLDVTNLVSLWASGALTQTSLALFPSNSTEEIYLTSRETITPPRLLVTCAPPVAPPPLGDANDDLQQAGLERLRQNSTISPTITRGHDGALAYASFDLAIPPGVASDGVARAQWFLEAYSDALRLSDPAAQLQLVRRTPDDANIYFRQLEAGIPVIPAEVGVHLSGEHVTGLTGNYLTDIHADPAPLISAERAEALALSQADPGAELSGETQLRFFNLGLTGAPDWTTYLAWEVNFENSLAFFVDASNGAVRYQQNRSLYGRPDLELNVQSADHNGPVENCAAWYLPPYASDACDEDDSPPCESSATAQERSAYTLTSQVFWWWWHTMNRDSYDDDGAAIQIYTRAGNSWKNAHFIPYGDCMEFGEGWVKMDVIAHEYGHALSEHRTGEDDIMLYENEPGAVNESFADILAHFVDNDEWLVGDELLASAVSSRHCYPSTTYSYATLRDMSNPPACGNPDRNYSDLKAAYTSNPTKQNDHGGVHSNSGILNKAAYLIEDGGVFNTYTVTGLGALKARWLLYYTLQRLPDAPGFVHVYHHGIAVAQDLARTGRFGFTDLDVCQVRNAFAAVEIGSGDHDCDGILDYSDPDDDNDFVPNIEDNCPYTSNIDQRNSDYDDLGNVCDTDDDNDGFPDAADNCPTVSNTGQEDIDNDQRGDLCDDSDGDRVVDAYDNCREVYNPDQRNTDQPSGDPYGDACEPDNDIDNDGVTDDTDNCSYVMNADQADSDRVYAGGGVWVSDHLGDRCDLCPGVLDENNDDPDHDGLGNPCDDDDDNDGILDNVDNCPYIANPAQIDFDGDGVGMDCDKDEADFQFNQMYQLNVRFNPAEELRLPTPGECLSCGGGYLQQGFTELLNLDMGIDFYAQVVNSEGIPVANTVLGGNLANQALSFRPVAYAFAAPTSLNAASGSSELAPDATRYWLQIIPPAGIDYNQTYTLTLQFSDHEGSELYLPLVLRK